MCCARRGCFICVMHCRSLCLRLASWWWCFVVDVAGAAVVVVLVVWTLHCATLQTTNTSASIISVYSHVEGPSPSPKKKKRMTPLRRKRTHVVPATLQNNFMPATLTLWAPHITKSLFVYAGEGRGRRFELHREDNSAGRIPNCFAWNWHSLWSFYCTLLSMTREDCGGLSIRKTESQQNLIKT